MFFFVDLEGVYHPYKVSWHLDKDNVFFLIQQMSIVGQKDPEKRVKS